MKPRYSAPAYIEIPAIEHVNFGLKTCFYSYLYVGNSKNLGLECNFNQSLEIRYTRVQLYRNGDLCITLGFLHPRVRNSGVLNEMSIYSCISKIVLQKRRRIRLKKKKEKRRKEGESRDRIPI